MKQILITTTLIICLITTGYSQSGLTFGLMGYSINQDPLVQWNEQYSQISQLTNPLVIPKQSVGYFVGVEIFSGSLNLGFTWVRQRRDSSSDDTDLFGNTIQQRLRIKYNHIEMPFFYFPSEGLIGIGSPLMQVSTRYGFSMTETTVK